MEETTSVHRRLAAAGAMAAILALTAPGATSGAPLAADGYGGEEVEIVVRGAPGGLADVVEAVRAAGGVVGRQLPIIDGVNARVPLPPHRIT